MPITRKVTDPKSYSSSSKKARKMPARVPLGLRRYLDVRGTPRGTYELTRTTVGYLDYTSTGFTIGAASTYIGASIVFSPTNTYIYSSPSGNSISMATVNAAEIAALFEKIKIDKVEITMYSSVHGAANSSTQVPLILMAEDDNDTSVSPDQIKQMNMKAWQPGDQNNTFKITVRPKYQRLVYYTALASSYEPCSGYVVAGTDIPHYGLKIGIEPLGAAGRIALTFKYFFKCKHLK